MDPDRPAAGPGIAPGVTARIHAAVEALRAGPGRVTGVSRFYRSPAFPAGSGPDFVNAAVALDTDETPEALLERLHRIEQDHGRERKIRWGARVLDLDLLACGDHVLPDARTWWAWHDLPLERQMREVPDVLLLPHPRIQDRAFVLVPMMDLAPDWVHPVLGRSIRAMSGDLPEEARAGLVPIS